MNQQALRIIAVGDLSFNGRFHRLLERHGPVHPFRHVLPHWSDADLRLGNLESPLTARPKVSPPKCTLRGAPQAIDALRHARFDFVAVANNHMMDFGPEGLAETCDKLDTAGIAHAGAGHDEKAACRPSVLLRNGQTVGLLAFCDVEQESPLYANGNCPGVAPLRFPACARQVRELRCHVDWLVVQVHWGQEMSQMPSPTQRDGARRLVDAGADLVLGHHPHVLQPMEMINGVPVYYSLGDFLFSEMYWRGRNELGEDFFAKMGHHAMSKATGWAEIVLAQHRAPQVGFHPAVLSRGLVVMPDDTPRRRKNWEALASRLSTAEYSAAFDAECRRADARLNSPGLWRSLADRVEVKLFKYGFVPTATEGS